MGQGIKAAMVTTTAAAPEEGEGEQKERVGGRRVAEGRAQWESTSDKRVRGEAMKKEEEGLSCSACVAGDQCSGTVCGQRRLHSAVHWKEQIMDITLLTGDKQTIAVAKAKGEKRREDRRGREEQRPPSDSARASPVGRRQRGSS